MCRSTLSAQIAKNGSELADLRKKGERDYFEFDIAKPKKNEMTRVADIQLQLRRTDPKKAKYDMSDPGRRQQAGKEGSHGQ